MGNTFGKLYKVTTFGESHGKVVGAVIDGCPAGISLCENDIQKYLDKRKANGSDLTTDRIEKDQVEILSGVLDGVTLGTPICAIVKNENLDASQYELLKKVYRPGHADYTYEKKFGIVDYRNGGRASGRETVGRVIGGAIAINILNKLGISIVAGGDYDLSKLENEKGEIDFDNVNDSIGGIIECVVRGVPAGLGEPVFEKLDARLAEAIMSIGAIKGVEFGAGFDVASMLGSECNDEILTDGKTLTNNAGGINGGVSNGNDIIIRMAVKPTPTISKKQKTIDRDNNICEVEFGGRNDLCIVDRVAVVVESMVAMTILDYYMIDKARKII